MSDFLLVYGEMQAVNVDICKQSMLTSNFVN